MQRSFKSQGMDVTIREQGGRVELEVNGQPIEVAKIDDQYHSQLAHQFKSFDTLDELVDTLLRNEGRYWKAERPAGPATGHGGHEGAHGGGGKPSDPRNVRKPGKGSER